MPKYMVQSTYTAEGAKGMLKVGGTARRKAVETLLASLGGRLESMYFTFGDEDSVIVMDLPDHVSAAAVSLAVTSSGTIRCRTTVLMSPEDIDEATKREIHFHPPGE
jgi:uncharacterized protein with GYD domain